MRRKAIDADATGWTIEDHVCRHCLGRIASKAGIYRCTGCGARAATVQAICACGLRGDGGRIAGFKCGRNPTPNAVSPVEIVVLRTGKEATSK